VRGEFAPPERWCAAVAAIGADADAPLVPVADAVFAAIAASIQEAALMAPAALAPDSMASSNTHRS
jgi:hypothetical protein